MKVYRAATTIHAPTETIWTILTDAPRYPDWDPTVDRIEGTIAPGQKLKAFSKLSPGRAFPVTVTEFVPNQKMTWSGGMPLGLFKGERTFTLTEKSAGTVEFVLQEVFSGPLLPLIGRTIPDLTGPFEQFAEGLKQHAERQSA